jgi:hypothetical protein
LPFASVQSICEDTNGTVWAVTQNGVLARRVGGKWSTPPEAWEFRRPWAYPNISLFALAGQADSQIATPTETYDPSKSDATAPAGAMSPTSCRLRLSTAGSAAARAPRLRRCSCARHRSRARCGRRSSPGPIG